MPARSGGEMETMAHIDLADVSTWLFEGAENCSTQS